MNADDLLRDLNTAQAEAVGSPLTNMLIIAGAGTGKTRVLVQRIAFLILKYNVRPCSILSVTFTNKAASEIKERLLTLLGECDSRYLWTCTFHSACLRILRNFFEAAGLSKDFKVIDTSDQLSIIKAAIGEMPQLEKLGVNPKEYLNRIMKLKERGIRPNRVVDIVGLEPYFSDVYCLYQSKCDKNNLVDFAELLLRCCELLRNNKVVKEYLNNKFKQILVDEFQDTNSIQYEWLNLIKGDDSNVLVVGDDDQSIYGWRGAVIENMHNFLHDYRDVKLIKLEKNYRSTSSILGVANSLIKNNSKRLVEKFLTTDNKGKDLVTIVQTENGITEANLVTKLIEAKLQEGLKPCQIAVLYRTNAQSRLLEKSLVNNDINYNILGGLRFFDREEIKNVLSYLSLIVNTDDNVAFSRIVNVPSRKIGATTIAKISTIASEFGISMFEAMKVFSKNSKSKPVENFISLINDLKIEMNSEKYDLSEFTSVILTKSGLDIYYVDKDRKEGSDDNRRTSNIEELILDMQSRVFVDEDEYFEDSTTTDSVVKNDDMTLKQNIVSFINASALVPSSEGDNNYESAIQLMTIHCAKGLEFDCVIVSGFEDQLLPLGSDTLDIEEERRLAYVAITRARKYLYLTYANNRIRYGSFGDFSSGGASIFLDEIDTKFYQKKLYMGYH